MNGIQFGSPPQEIVNEWVRKYKIPIEVAETDLGDVYYRALSIEEVESIYASATVKGEVNDELFREEELRRCVLWPAKFVEVCETNADVIPGGILNTIVEGIESLSGMRAYKPYNIEEYKALLEEYLEAEEEAKQNNEEFVAPNLEVHKNHPTMAEVDAWIGSQYDSDGKSIRKVFVICVDITDTDYVYRSFSAKEMAEYDKDLASQGGLTTKSFEITSIQKYIVGKLVMFPQDVTNRIATPYSFPAWLPAILAEGIFQISGSIRKRRVISTG